jgi:hypothetical protein
LKQATYTWKINKVAGEVVGDIDVVGGGTPIMKNITGTLGSF